MTATTPDTPRELAPDELARLTAEYLTAVGITVTRDGIEFELDPGAAFAPGPGDAAREVGAALWSLGVDEHANARLYFVPAKAGASDPRWIAGIAAALLGGTPAADGQEDSPRPSSGGGGIQCAAGLDLRRRGFTVKLNPYVDDQHLELCADVSATAPGGTGTVYLTDEGTICFERPYWCDHSATEWEPEYRTWLPDPSAPARAIAETVTAAIAAARVPASGNGPGEGQK